MLIYKDSEEEQSRTRRASTPYLRQIISDFYRTAQSDYEYAGKPFGDCIHSMLIWFEFGQETTSN